MAVEQGTPQGNEFSQQPHADGLDVNNSENQPNLKPDQGDVIVHDSIASFYGADASEELQLNVVSAVSRLNSVDGIMGTVLLRPSDRPQNLHLTALVQPDDVGRTPFKLMEDAGLIVRDMNKRESPEANFYASFGMYMVSDGNVEAAKEALIRDRQKVEEVELSIAYLPATIPDALSQINELAPVAEKVLESDVSLGVLGPYSTRAMSWTNEDVVHESPSEWRATPDY